MTTAELARARYAVATVFGLTGFGLATWMARIPEVRDHLDLTAGELGRVLLALAVGSAVALPTAGLVVEWIGAARAVVGGALLAGSGLVLVGLGAGPLASVPVVVGGLFLFGYGTGVWDVAMNVEGAALERRLGRSIMPRLHAGFSVGTVAGAGLGAAAAAVHLSVGWHVGGVGVLATVAAVLATGWFLPPAGDGDHPRPPRHQRYKLRHAWREPRTVLIGVLVLAFALSEGIAYDWLAVGLVDGLGVSHATAAIGLAVFVTAMTTGRALGTLALDRFGRVRVLRASAAVAAAGAALVVFGGSLPLALAGALGWGLGTALGFPVGMSAAADDPQRAPIRVSVVASVAYTAFLAGPPLLGTIGDQVGVLRALLVAVAALAVGLAVAPATRYSGTLPASPPTRYGVVTPS